MEFDEHGVGHCYDNIFADIYLHGGKDVKGIYQYVDVFTPGGYIAVFIFAALRTIFNEAVFNIVVGGVMAVAYYQTKATMDLCVTSDTMMQLSIFGQSWNACNIFWDSDGNGIAAS